MSGGGRRFNLNKAELEKGTAKRVIKELWKYLKKYPIGLTIIVLSILFSTAFNLTLPFVLRHVIDEQVKVEVINMQAISIIVASLIVGSFFVSILNYFQQ